MKASRLALALCWALPLYPQKQQPLDPSKAFEL
jgi:hypothetical protein